MWVGLYVLKHFYLPNMQIFFSNIEYIDHEKTPGHQAMWHKESWQAHHKMTILLQIVLMDNPKFTCESEIWGIFCEFKV